MLKFIEIGKVLLTNAVLETANNNQVTTFFIHVCDRRIHWTTHVCPAGHLYILCGKNFWLSCFIPAMLVSMINP